MASPLVSYRRVESWAPNRRSTRASRLLPRMDMLAGALPPDEEDRRESRLARFRGDGRSRKRARPEVAAAPSGEPIVGESQSLDKQYLRLTSEARPEEVRPPTVLAFALDRLKTLWRGEGADYAYVCEQLKSIRQDLTLQRLGVDLKEHLALSVDVCVRRA